jgi:hypothetical protein
VQNLTRECAQQSAVVDEDIKDYCNAWEELTELTKELPSCVMPEFKYKTAEELDGFLISADLDSYSGGGYIVNIKGQSKDIRKNLVKLQQQRWINNQTRAVIFEFATYNVNINVFVVVSVTAEFLPGGGVRPHWRLDPIRLLTPITAKGILVYFCMILFLVFIVSFILREVGEIAAQRWAYWSSYWAWLEWLIIMTAISAVAFWCYKFSVTKELLGVFSTTFGNGYMKLQHVALIDEFYGYHLGILIFLANIKLLKILKFNHKMSLLIYTLAQCWGDLSGFLAIFFMAFGSFVQMFYLILYCELDDFKTLLRTFETCFTMMLNKFKFGKLKETSTVAAVMFFFFAVSVNWILVNVLLTIIIEGYERVKRQLAGKGNELEVIQYIKDAARSLAGRGPRPEFLSEYAPGGPDTGRLVVEAGAGGDGEEEEEGNSVVSELPCKVDQFLEYVNRIYFDGELDLGTKKVLKADMEKDEKEEEDDDVHNEDDDEEKSMDNEKNSMDSDNGVDPDWEAELAEAERLGDAYFDM